MELTEIFKNIPQVEKILQVEDINSFIPVLGRGIVLGIIRDEISSFRERLKNDSGLPVEELFSSIVAGCVQKKREKLQRVINGTGVVLHTNLGRSPISGAIFKKLTEALSGYCNLEFYLPEKKRGRRGGFTEELLSRLCQAEDALIVNNNASSVFLILHEFARNREVLVSRGELIQIGGGFRIPDVMRETGARLVEVGTTNITDINDYKKSISENTAMIFSAHQSNFKIRGFASIPTVKELSALKTQSVLLVRDIGSGNLVQSEKITSHLEPTVRSEINAGADLVCFSGDKLLGSCQAGIIVGRRDLIEQLKSNPLMRMLRVDKVTYFLLQETLIHYMNNDPGGIRLWDIILQDTPVIMKKISRLVKAIKSPIKKDVLKRLELKSTFGGGTLPTVSIKSAGLQIDLPDMKAGRISNILLESEPPVVGYILDGKYTIDFRTILPEDIPALAASIDKLLEGRSVSA